MTHLLQTHSGRLFDVLAPTAAMIEIGDIAHALANTCRFGGHTSTFYSVAQHSVLVAGLVPRSAGRDVRLAALLHDAAEAYVGDIPAPLKGLLGPGFGEIEERVRAATFHKFLLPVRMPAIVHTADLVALATERRDVLAEQVRWAMRLPAPDSARILPLTPWSAERAFLATWRRLVRA